MCSSFPWSHLLLSIHHPREKTRYARKYVHVLHEDQGHPQTRSLEDLTAWEGGGVEGRLSAKSDPASSVHRKKVLFVCLFV